MKGGNRHQDRILYGDVPGNDMHRVNIRLLKGIGGEFLHTGMYIMPPVIFLSYHLQLTTPHL